MNTIRRPRKRPRKSSVSFRTLGWLLVREGFARIVWRELAELPRLPADRKLLSEEAHRLHRRAAAWFILDPWRRYYP